MAYTLSNKYAKNLCKRTVLLQLIIKKKTWSHVFLEHSVYTQIRLETMVSMDQMSWHLRDGHPERGIRHSLFRTRFSLLAAFLVTCVILKRPCRSLKVIGNGVVQQATHLLSSL